MRIRLALVLLGLASNALSQPLVDYHQHLFNPSIAALSPGLDPVTAPDLIALLDAAGIRRAVILSVAYMFGNPNKPAIENEYERVKAENDWTSQQASRYADRLIAFCGVNPLKDYAISEIARCSKDPQLRRGLKLHFGNSDVDLENKEHLERIRRTFREANQRNMAIVVHMRPSVTRQRSYGAMKARIFLQSVLPQAPDIPIQIAHLAGAGAYDDPAIDEALAVFVEAIANHDKRMARVYFDVSGVAGYGEWEKKAGVIASRIRQLGVKRVLYGSDGAGKGNLAPRDAALAFRKLPLTETEFQTIESNLAPYLK